MGFMDNLMGRTGASKHSRREERKNERLRQSGGSLSPTGSQTHGHRPHGNYGLFGNKGHPTRRQSQRSGQSSPEPQYSHSQQTTPQQSPRAGQGQGGPGFGDKFKQFMSFSPGQQAKSQKRATPPGSPRQQQQQQWGPAPSAAQQYYQPQPRTSNPGRTSASGAGTAASSQQVRDLQHKVSVMESQLQELEEVKRRLISEQRTANEWKEKWNLQNFKLNLMADMLVMRVLELDQGGTTAAAPPPVQPTAAAAAAVSLPSRASAPSADRPGGNFNAGSSSAVSEFGRAYGSSGMAGVGKMAGSRQDPEIIEESFDDY